MHLALTIELIGELVCLQYHPLDRVESRAGALVLVTLGLERQVRHLLHTVQRIQLLAELALSRVLLGQLVAHIRHLLRVV